METVTLWLLITVGGYYGHEATVVERFPTVEQCEHVRKSMQGNKRANTKPELLMRQRLRDAGLTGYRLQWKVPGHPDIAWPGKKVALFVNGCFWHRCPHCRPSAPKSHVEYWMVKLDRNVERDARNMQALRDAGWKVHVVWECQLKKKAIDATLAELLPKLAVDLGKTLRLSSIREEDGDADRLSGSDSASLESASPEDGSLEGAS